jgi:hypothetical protein
LKAEPTIETPSIAPSENVEIRPASKSATRLRAVEKIRSELNIEKWPAIWQPSKSKNKSTLRVMEREGLASDGSRVVSRVEVGYTQLGTLSTEEQKTLYVLIKLWEEGGKPDTQVFFSSRGLARLLKKKGWGTNVIQAITKSLRKLRTIPIEWINSYFDKTENGAVVVDRRPFTILGDLRIVERRQDGAVNSSLGYFKFDDHVLTNLQLNYTKPVCIDEFFKLKSEIAQLIYSHVDLMLFDKSKYERRSRELFDDLGLRNAEYGHMYERKRAIARALKELNGIRLSSGVLKSATLERTADRKDYKVVFSKSKAAAIDVAALENLPKAAPSGLVINDYSKTKDPLTAAAEELVAHFYRLFHAVEKHHAQSKETAQALSLITQHGVAKSRHIVEFARTAAAATNYTPQTFGGILQYASRGAADFDSRSQAVAPPVAVPAEPTEKQRRELELRARGECRLAILTAEQYSARLDQARAALFAQNPFMARQSRDSKIREGALRSWIVRQLAQKPMDLLILDGRTDPESFRRKLFAQDLPL